MQMSAQSNKMECPCSIGCQMQLQEQAVVWKMPSQVLGTSRCLLLGTSCKNTLKSCASHLVLLHGKGKCAQGIQNHICWKGKIIAHTCQHFTKNGIFTVSFFFFKENHWCGILCYEIYTSDILKFPFVIHDICTTCSEHSFHIIHV